MSINLFAPEATNGAAVTTKDSNPVEIAAGLHAYQLVGTATGAGSAVCDIKVSNDDLNWITLGTITLTLINGSVSDGFTSFSAWKSTKATISTLSGADAAVKVWVN